MRAVVASLAVVAAASTFAARAHAACTETVPPGATKPTVTERVPDRATAGALVKLEIVVRHAAGESATLPSDLPRAFGDEVRVADDGSWGKGALPKTAPDPGDPAHATTVLEVPLVVLSTSLPRKTFTIPELRVVVLRKGGGDLSVCSASHTIAIDQPTANTTDPFPKPNPPSVPQRMRDERAQSIAIAAVIAATAALLIAALLVWLRRRPKPLPAPPQPVPSWKIAQEAIRAARRDLQAGTIDTKLYYDRISDAVRAHLGATYGFDGLEQTSDEILVRLKRIPSPMVPYADVEKLLSECDLVKFAGFLPQGEEDTIAELASTVVRNSTRETPLRSFERRREEEVIS